MIRDPVFGGIDWDAVKQLAFGIFCTLFILSFGAATSGNWYDPYVWAGAYIGNHSPQFIFSLHDSADGRLPLDAV